MRLPVPSGPLLSSSPTGEITTETATHTLRLATASSVGPQAKLARILPLLRAPNRGALVAELPDEAVVQLVGILGSARASAELAQLVDSLRMCGRPPAHAGDAEAAVTANEPAADIPGAVLQLVPDLASDELAAAWLRWAAQHNSPLLQRPKTFNTLLRACAAAQAQQQRSAVPALQVRSQVVLSILALANARDVQVDTAALNMALRTLGRHVQVVDERKHQSVSGRSNEDAARTTAAEAVREATAIVRQMFKRGTMPAHHDMLWLFTHLTGVHKSLEASQLLLTALSNGVAVRTDLVGVVIRGLITERRGAAAYKVFVRASGSGVITPSAEILEMLLHHFAVTEPNFEIIGKLYADMRIVGIPATPQMYRDIEHACRVSSDLTSLLRFGEDDPELARSSDGWLAAVIDLSVLDGNVAALERVAGLIERDAAAGRLPSESVEKAAMALLNDGRVAVTLQVVRGVWARADSVLVGKLPASLFAVLVSRMSQSSSLLSIGGFGSTATAPLGLASDAATTQYTSTSAAFASTLTDAIMAADGSSKLDDGVLVEFAARSLGRSDTQAAGIAVCTALLGDSPLDAASRRWPVLSSLGYLRIADRLAEAGRTDLAVRAYEAAAVHGVRLGGVGLMRWRALVTSEPGLARPYKSRSTDLDASRGDVSGLALLAASMIREKVPVDNQLLRLCADEATNAGWTARKLAAVVRWGLRVALRLVDWWAWLDYAAEAATNAQETSTASAARDIYQIERLVVRLAAGGAGVPGMSHDELVEQAVASSPQARAVLSRLDEAAGVSLHSAAPWRAAGWIRAPAARAEGARSAASVRRPAGQVLGVEPQ
ncbi:hypothetical protein HK105_203430 [Polyrhizophydium stewartii]|uniref:Uncharacterized protein n=1 Tax=Polyrhizophydium stewartii TaxID=2732419 RepID=A0ABR4NBW4_9FUNG